ncbi:multicopper oxidase family protein [Mycobacteroides salmoniphilum]|uniref:multicopper oxidase family protein n=1 Tax=Mycobacteroides salmoniphilum TaxID=404941 RepID=UPI0010CFDE90|nr:multicopper oxidase domain-containing protein [Mycobacteroides salmoniphilum]TDZ98070.1 Multicopper oxidase mco [Mycobacteroides salmoniphilum]
MMAPRSGSRNDRRDTKERARAKRWRIAAIVLGAPLAVVMLALGASFLYPYVRGVQHVNAGTAAQRPLAIPPLAEPAIINGEKVFTLTATDGRTELLPGAHSDTAGYNGSYLGPTIRARTGDRVRLQVTNRLGQTTTVHWHGMHVPARMDGGPHQPIAPGATWSPHWTIQNSAATLWYHPHTLGATAQQVYSGLAGMFLIDDDNSDTLGLPAQYGIDDIPLIVQDRNFDADNKLTYLRNRTQDNFGELGDTILVNGTHAPYLQVPRKLVRLRILNASNARRYNFGFSDERPFHQIATDGALLPAAAERTRMLLSPGERAEILVDMTDTDRPVTLMSYEVPGAATMYHLMRTLTVGDNDEYQRFTILDLRPTGTPTPRVALPEKLNTIEPLRTEDSTRTRTFRITDRMSINGQPMDHARVDEVVTKGDTEIWEIDNQEALFYHPFHIHHIQFQILDRDGRPPQAYEQGWKDTVDIAPFEKVRLIAKFDTYADTQWPYMYHCHILEHEDMGMMGQYIIVEQPADKPTLQSPLIGQHHSSSGIGSHRHTA